MGFSSVGPSKVSMPSQKWVFCVMPMWVTSKNIKTSSFDFMMQK